MDNNKQSFQTDGIMQKGYGFIPKLIMKDTELTIEAKAIYAYLASYTGAGNTAYPSISLMCGELDISKARFYNHRKLLVNKGYIVIEKKRNEGGWSNNVYKLPFKPYPQNLTTQNLTTQNLDTRNLTTKSNSSKSNSIKSNKDKELSISKQLTKKEQTDEVVNSYKLDDSVKDTFQEYLKMRKEIKARMSDHAIKLLLTKLTSITDNPKEQKLMLENSIMGNWKSVFPLKDQTKTNTPEKKGRAVNYLE